MPVRVVVGGDVVSSASVRVYTDSGSSASLVYSRNYGTAAQAVAVGSDLAFYAGGAVTSSVVTRKWNAAGTEITTDDWPIDNHAFTVRGIAVDASHNVHVVHLRTTDSEQIRKYNSGGTQQWMRQHLASAYAVAVDASGNVYLGAARASSITTRKYNSAGTLQWSVDHGATVNGIAVDASGNVYTAGNRTSSTTTRKYNSSGTQVTTGWPKDHGTTCNGIAVDADGNVYTVGNRTSSITTRKYASNGTEVTTGNWPIDHGAAVFGCVFVDGHLYTTGTRTGNLTTRKYAPDGTLVWSLDYGAGAGAIAAAYYGELAAPPLALPIRLGLPFATLAAGATSEPPGLALPFALRVPLLITDREDLAPGLALNLALRLPTLRLEHPRAFQLQEVYALYLGGVLLPFSSISARRDAGGLSLNVTIPSASAELLAAVAANESGTLRVLRGPRLPDGSVQLDGLWNAALDTWSYRAGAEAGSITLQASAPTAIQAVRPRPLREVSYIGSGQGVRRVRCRIDTYLQPGDVALLGAGQTLAVSDLTYSIQPGAAFMEVRGF
jgi:streptogramin lyase